MNGPSKLSQLPDKTSSTAAGAGAASGAAGYKSPQAQANQGFPSGYAAEASYSAPTQYNQAYPTQGQGQGQYGQQGGAMYSQAPQTSQAPHVNTDMSDRYVFCIDQVDLFFNLFMMFPILLRFILTLFLCVTPLYLSFSSSYASPMSNSSTLLFFSTPYSSLPN